MTETYAHNPVTQRTKSANLNESITANKAKSEGNSGKDLSSNFNRNIIQCRHTIITPRSYRSFTFPLWFDALFFPCRSIYSIFLTTCVSRYEHIVWIYFILCDVMCCVFAYSRKWCTMFIRPKLNGKTKMWAILRNNGGKSRNEQKLYRSFSPALYRPFSFPSSDYFTYFYCSA